MLGRGLCRLGQAPMKMKPVLCRTGCRIGRGSARDHDFRRGTDERLELCLARFGVVVDLDAQDEPVVDICLGRAEPKPAAASVKAAKLSAIATARQ
jgi:hypothetical protein